MGLHFKCSTCVLMHVDSISTAAAEHRFRVSDLFSSDKLNFECILMHA